MRPSFEIQRRDLTRIDKITESLSKIQFPSSVHRVTFYDWNYTDENDLEGFVEALFDRKTWYENVTHVSFESCFSGVIYRSLRFMLSKTSLLRVDINNAISGVTASEVEPQLMHLLTHSRDIRRLDMELRGNNIMGMFRTININNVNEPQEIHLYSDLGLSFDNETPMFWNWFRNNTRLSRYTITVDIVDPQDLFLENTSALPVPQNVAQHATIHLVFRPEHHDIPLEHLQTLRHVVANRFRLAKNWTACNKECHPPERCSCLSMYST